MRKSYNGIKGLLSGMALTLGYLVRFDKVITQQYPENRDTLRLPKRSRGQVQLVKDPATGIYKCTTCGLCAKACPNNSIGIEKVRDPETKKFKLVKYEYHLERCTQCGLCVDACKLDALTMNSTFENAVYDRADLTVNLAKDQPPAAPKPPAENPPPAAPGAEPAKPTEPKEKPGSNA